MQRKKAGTNRVDRHGAHRSGPPDEKFRGNIGVSPVPPTVSGRWLLGAVAIALIAAAFFSWAALCLLFWQGSWQLLYHPASAVVKTPASVGLPFDSISFATTESGEPRLKGWWVPAAANAPYTRFTILYLHGPDGNLGDSVDSLASLHAVGLNVLAFDYRGYGQSQFVHPSEANWRQDAEWALRYLTTTRHVAPSSIILDGRSLGANLALQVAAAHPELAGVVLESPMNAPVSKIFSDARAHLVPAHLLVRDRFDMNVPAASLKVPSLWYLDSGDPSKDNALGLLEAFQKITAPKMQVWLAPSSPRKSDFASSLARWLDDLH